jgi:glycosyltransferase involved in cell wall biosynthesis
MNVEAQPAPASTDVRGTAKVAVITRTKDRPILLERALASVSRQTFGDFIWMIVNDGGDPAPVDAIAERARKDGIDVHVIHHATSHGMEAASNAGIAACHSEYILIHDDDDSLEPLFLEKTVDFLEAKSIYLGVVTHSVRVDEELTADACIERSRSPHNIGLQSIYLAEIAAENAFPPISFLFRRSVYNEVGRFNESLPVLGDWDFNLRVLERGDIGVIPEMLANYHHRVALTDQNDVYGNSIYAGISKHQEYDGLIRNAYLRRDLAHGRPGLGALVNQGRLHQRQTHVLYRVSALIDMAKRLTERRPFRWIPVRSLLAR